jgi:hypothetical protein
LVKLRDTPDGISELRICWSLIEQATSKVPFGDGFVEPAFSVSGVVSPHRNLYRIFLGPNLRQGNAGK